MISFKWKLRFGELIYSFASFIFYYTGFYKIISYLKRKQPMIIGYHSINEGEIKHIYPNNVIHSSNFEKQIAYLKEFANIIPLNELIRKIMNDEDIEPYTVALTFDDGYYDFKSKALPIIEKFKVPVTLFVPTKFIDCPDELKWEDELTLLINNVKDVLEVLLNHDRFQSDLTESHNREYFTRELVNYINNNHIDEVKIITQKISEMIDTEVIYPVQSHLSWEDLNDIKMNNLIQIDSHSHSHLILGYASYDDVMKEIETSKKLLKKKLGICSKIFSYPLGIKQSFNEFIKKILEQHGYVGAVASRPGRITKNTDLFEIPRYTSFDDSSFRFKCALVGLRDLFIKLWGSQKNII